MRVQVNDTIIYRPSTGGQMKVAQIQTLEICKEGEKYGRCVNSCDTSKHKGGVAGLSDGHWCYFEQIYKKV